jgi:hypothetical protein
MAQHRWKSPLAVKEECMKGFITVSLLAVLLGSMDVAAAEMPHNSAEIERARYLANHSTVIIRGDTLIRYNIIRKYEDSYLRNVKMRKIEYLDPHIRNVKIFTFVEDPNVMARRYPLEIGNLITKHPLRNVETTVIFKGNVTSQSGMASIGTVYVEKHGSIQRVKATVEIPGNLTVTR